MLVPHHDYVGLKRSGVRLGKRNCLKEGYHQFQNPHGGVNRGVLLTSCGALAKQLSPEEGTFGLGLCVRLDPDTTDGVRLGAQTLES